MPNERTFETTPARRQTAASLPSTGRGTNQIDRRRQYLREYYAANRDRLIEYQREYAARHRRKQRVLPSRLDVKRTLTPRDIMQATTDKSVRLINSILRGERYFTM